MARPKGIKETKPRAPKAPKLNKLASKQMRVSAQPEDLQEIEAWLAEQKSAAQTIAKLLLKQARSQAKK
ncbi:MAG: hypothetical protein ACRCYY_03675 [Trueperaceae bacterium]